MERRKEGNEEGSKGEREEEKEGMIEIIKSTISSVMEYIKLKPATLAE